eukprot:5598762-Prymnesium_polylepis.1
MDGELLQRCASRSAAGADGLPRPERDRVRYLRCTRVDGRMSSTLSACEGVPRDVSTYVPQPLH